MKIANLLFLILIAIACGCNDDMMEEVTIENQNGEEIDANNSICSDGGTLFMNTSFTCSDNRFAIPDAFACYDETTRVIRFGSFVGADNMLLAGAFPMITLNENGMSAQPIDGYTSTLFQLSEESISVELKMTGIASEVSCSYSYERI